MIEKEKRKKLKKEGKLLFIFISIILFLTSSYGTATSVKKLSLLPPKIEYLGGDGLSIENAIIIKGARTHKEGADAEWKYMILKYGQPGRDWLPLSQTTLSKRNRIYSKFEIILLPSRKKFDLYFDITDFFYKIP